MEQRSFWDASSKAMFAMGLFLGLAISAIIGLGFVVAKGGIVTSTPTVVAGGNNPTPSPTVDPSTGEPPMVLSAQVDDSDHILGPKNAKVTLVEYADFECPFCKRFKPTLEQALKDFPNDVRLVYRHYPLTMIHPRAQKSAEASECAAKLGGNDAFWKMHDELMAATDLSDTAIQAMGKKLGLNEGQFNSCLSSGEMANLVSADVQTGDASGVQGTPSTFVNGKGVSGALPYESLKAEIQAALNAS